MRRLLTTMASLAIAAPLTAQGFEGTVKMESKADGQTIDMTMYIKGNMQAVEVVMPASAGPMAGNKARMVIDHGSKQITMMIPAGKGMPLPPGTNGMKMVMPMDRVTGEVAKQDVSIRKLGTSQTVAGMKCDDYAVTSDSTVMNACVTDKLGQFILPRSGPPGRGQQSPAWSRAFGDKPMFPLKVWKADDDSGAVMMVTSINRGSVPAGVFDTAAEGYMDMSAMMGGRRPGGN